MNILTAVFLAEYIDQLHKHFLVWRSIVLRTKTNKQTIRFEHFVKFVEDEAKKVNDLTYGSSAIGIKSKTNSNRNIDQRRGIRQGSACATDTFLRCVLSLDNRNIVLGSLSDSTFLDVLTSKLQYSFLVYVVSYSMNILTAVFLAEYIDQLHKHFLCYENS
jgi:hypothetical protein